MLEGFCLPVAAEGAAGLEADSGDSCRALWTDQAALNYTLLKSEVRMSFRHKLSACGSYAGFFKGISSLDFSLGACCFIACLFRFFDILFRFCNYMWDGYDKSTEPNFQQPEKASDWLPAPAFVANSEF